MALQGFPVRRLEEPEVFKFVKNQWTEAWCKASWLAMGMASTPTMLAIVMSTFAAVNWVDDDDQTKWWAEEHKEAPVEDEEDHNEGDVSRNMLLGLAEQNVPSSVAPVAKVAEEPVQNVPSLPPQRHGGILSRVICAPRSKKMRT